MEKHFNNNSLEIYFESEKTILKVCWLPNNSSLSPKDYIDNWIVISKYINVLKPIYLFIDASEFEYRTLPELSNIFNDIYKKLKPENIAIKTGNNILGRKTLEDLLKKCAHRNHNTLINSNKEEYWFKF